MKRSFLANAIALSAIAATFLASATPAFARDPGGKYRDAIRKLSALDQARTPWNPDWEKAMSDFNQALDQMKSESPANQLKAFQAGPPSVAKGLALRAATRSLSAQAFAIYDKLEPWAQANRTDPRIPTVSKYLNSVSDIVTSVLGTDKGPAKVKLDDLFGDVMQDNVRKSCERIDDEFKRGGRSAGELASGRNSRLDLFSDLSGDAGKSFSDLANRILGEEDAINKAADPLAKSVADANDAINDAGMNDVLFRALQAEVQSSKGTLSKQDAESIHGQLKEFAATVKLVESFRQSAFASYSQDLATVKQPFDQCLSEKAAVDNLFKAITAFSQVNQSQGSGPEAVPALQNSAPAERMPASGTSVTPAPAPAPQQQPRSQPRKVVDMPM